jgi:2-polyprenyl-3-methyl-5-hydroxy-6-metoxy-1,4-benzoquinol methylase
MTPSSSTAAAPGDVRGGARRRFEAFVRWTIEVERAAAADFLPEGEREPFLAYYRALPAPGDEAAIRRYLRGLWRSEAGWTSRWIAERGDGANGTPSREVAVLDAGSGFGTYSMLYAAVGATVIGVDLRPDRLSAAARRLEFHEKETGQRFPITYERADLTRTWPRDYDLVWVYNALSHIDPLEGFLNATRTHLKPGGVLVVGDINGAHPAHLKRLAEIRSEVHQEYVAPDGQRHAYAVERPFPPGEMRSIMEQHGFRVVHHEGYWGGLGVLPEPLYAGLVSPLQKWWSVGESVARRQLMVATPAARKAQDR